MSQGQQLCHVDFLRLSPGIKVLQETLNGFDDDAIGYYACYWSLCMLICVIDDVCAPSSSFKDSRQLCSIAAALGCGRLLHPAVLNSMRVGPGPEQLRN